MESKTDYPHDKTRVISVKFLDEQGIMQVQLTDEYSDLLNKESKIQGIEPNILLKKWFLEAMDRKGI